MSETTAAVTPAPAPSQDPVIQQAIQDVSQEIPAAIQDVKNSNVTGLVTEGEKLYTQVSPLVPALVQEAKAGYKTTEFWLLLLWEATTQTGAIHLPSPWGKLIAGLGGLASYILSRGVAKSGSPNQVPQV